MAWFADLTPYQYLEEAPPRDSAQRAPGPALNVGWLEPGHALAEGPVPAELLPRLAELVMYARVQLTRGLHICGFAHPGAARGPAGEAAGLLVGDRGSGEIRVVGEDGTRFAAPAMIHHYVSEHGYRPPDAFIAAALRHKDLDWARARAEDLCLSCGGALRVERTAKTYQAARAEDAEALVEIVHLMRAYCAGCGIHYERTGPPARGKNAEIRRAVDELTAADAATRRWAAVDLGILRGDKGLQALILRLDDPDYEVQRAAVKALSVLKAEAALEPLIAHLGTPDEATRDSLIAAIALIGGSAAAPLVGVHLQSPDPVLRGAAVLALARLEGSTARDLLLRCLDDAESSIRREAVGALVKGADAVSRRLLSEELDGNPPFLDPRTPLTERWLIQTAGRLGFPTSKVRAKVEALAEPFMLRLAWDRGE